MPEASDRWVSAWGSLVKQPCGQVGAGGAQGTMDVRREGSQAGVYLGLLRHVSWAEVGGDGPRGQRRGRHRPAQHD